jgi:hypothetical protein
MMTEAVREEPVPFSCLKQEYFWRGGRARNWNKKRFTSNCPFDCKIEPGLLEIRSWER